MYPSAVLSSLVFLSFFLSCDTADLSSRKGRINRLKSIITPVEDAPEVVPVTTTVMDVPTSDEVVLQKIPSTTESLSLEDRQIETFHSLFEIYQRVLGKYSVPGKIEWHRVNVKNWPETVSKSDATSWTEDDVAILNALVELGEIEFKINSRNRRNPCDPLILPKKNHLNVDLRSVVQLKDIRSNNFDSDGSSLQSCSEHEAEAVNSSEKAAASSDSDSDEEVLQNLVTKNSKTKKVALTKKDDMNERESVLANALNIYRKLSGDKTATEIDWNRSHVHYLQNHKLPFSTGFETEEDVSTLKKLMNNKFFGFHDYTSSTSRKIRIYERLYQLYAGLPHTKKHDEYIIKWDQLDVQGWPEGIPRSYSHWKKEKIEILENLLDTDAIKFHLKSEKSHLKRKQRDSDSESESDSVASSADTLDSKSVDELPKKMAKKAKDLPKKKLVEKSSDSRKNVTEKSAELPKKTATVSTSKNDLSRIVVTKVADSSVRISSDTAAIVQEGPYAGVTVPQLEKLRSELTVAISSYTAAKIFYQRNFILNQICSEILLCLNLLLQFTNVPPVVSAIRLSRSQVFEYLEVFRMTLDSVQPNGSLNDEIWSNFIIKCSEFHGSLL